VGWFKVRVTQGACGVGVEFERPRAGEIEPAQGTRIASEVRKAFHYTANGEPVVVLAELGAVARDAVLHGGIEGARLVSKSLSKDCPAPQRRGRRKRYRW
jgi:hypothetical protein